METGEFYLARFRPKVLTVVTGTKRRHFVKMKGSSSANAQKISSETGQERDMIHH